MSDKQATNTTPDLSGLRLDVRFEEVEGAPRMRRLRISLQMARLTISQFDGDEDAPSSGIRGRTEFEEIDSCTLIVPVGTLFEDR